MIPYLIDYEQQIVSIDVCFISKNFTKTTIQLIFRFRFPGIFKVQCYKHKERKIDQKPCVE